MEDKQRDKLLRNFPDLEYRGTKMVYNEGRSSASVFAAQFRKKPSSDRAFDKTYVVKIERADRIEKEKEFYDALSTTILTPLLAPVRAISDPLDGKVAVAYDVAFQSLLDSTSLFNILRTEGIVDEAQVIQQIERLSQALVEYHLKEGRIQDNQVLSPDRLLADILGEGRMKDIESKLAEMLPDWPQRDTSLLFENRVIRNPVPYLKPAAWQGKNYNPTAPQGAVHGDLHTGNILFDPTAKIDPNDKNATLPPPILIDFGQTRPDGVPLFDFAYLEFDIIQNVFRADIAANPDHWFTLFNHSMSDIIPKTSDRNSGEKKLPDGTPWPVVRAWKFIRPIRRAVEILLKSVEKEDATMGENYKIAWWFTAVAVGLNFARKGDEHRPQQERKTSLLYAAYGLERIYTLLKYLPPATTATPGQALPSVFWRGAGNDKQQNPVPIVTTAPVTSNEKLWQQYLETLQNETSEKIDFSGLYLDTTGVKEPFGEIPLTQAFTWPDVFPGLPQADTLRREQNQSLPVQQTRSMSQVAASGLSSPAKLSDVLVKHPYLVILGDVGAGKTTILRYLLLQIAHGDNEIAEQFPLLPVFIDMQSYINGVIPTSLGNFLKEYLAHRYDDSYASFLLEQAKKGKVLFLFDGLDSITDKGVRTTVVQQIRDFSQAKDFKENRYIVTSRIIGYSEAQLHGDYYVYTLADFTDGQIETFIKHWYIAYTRSEKKAKEVALLLRSIQRDTSVRCLASNPLLLTTFVTLQLPANVRPFHRTKYFKHCVSVLLDTWPASKNYEPPSSIEDLYHLLRHLAFWLHENPTAKNLSIEDLAKRIKQQLEIDHMDKLLGQNIEQHITFIRRKAGILIEQPERHYQFLFPPLMDYLVADVLVQRNDKYDFIRQHLHDLHFHEVIRQAVGITFFQQDKVNQDNQADVNALMAVILPATSPSKAIFSYNLLFAGLCIADNAGFYSPIEDGIIGQIVQHYLVGPSNWLRTVSSCVLKAWSDTPIAVKLKRVLLSLFSNIDTDPTEDQAPRPSSWFDPTPPTWDEQMLQRYRGLTQSDKEREGKKLRLRASALLYLLGALSSAEITTQIDEAKAAVSNLSSEVRQVAAATLGVLGQDQQDQTDIISALASALSDSDWQVRSAAADAFVSLAHVHPEVLTSLRNIFTDTSASLMSKEAAITALGQISYVRPEVLDDILHILLIACAEDNSSFLSKEAGVAALQPGDHSQSELLPAIPSVLAQSTSPLKRTLMITVGQIASQQLEDTGIHSKILDLLRTALSHGDSSVRQAAATALGCLVSESWQAKQQDMINSLYIARSDSYLPVREAASRALRGFTSHLLPVDDFLPGTQ